MEDIKETEEVVQDEVKEDSSNTESEKPSKNDKKKKKSKEQIKIESLEAELASLRDESRKARESYLTARADLENSRRRIQEEAINERKYAAINIVSDLITPVDMLNRVCQMETDDEKLKNFLIGFQMISQQITDILTRNGLSEIEAKGKLFDSNVHQAVSKEHVDGVEPGIVLDVLQTGFKYKDRIIRPAMVKVSE